jgi:DNA polymerase I-like protein with 3'-5' exonuclease and polymerase domains
VDKKGSYVLTKKGKTYSMRTEVLRNTLSSAATAIGQPVFQSAGKNKAVSTSAKLWVQYADRVPFIGAWTRTVTSKDLLKFFDIFGSAESDRVHPRYDTLKNTGRTGSSRPNIQQTPRNGKFRRCYVAPAGKLLAVVDYSFIELRTLAAVCYATYGRSVLGDVIKAGVDPHAYTAAMINGLDLDAFLALKKSDPDKFKGDRQAAKALNFGIPGGLGPRKLVDYARTTYKVTMSIEQAREFRHRRPPPFPASPPPHSTT